MNESALDAMGESTGNQNSGSPGTRASEDTESVVGEFTYTPGNVPNSIWLVVQISETETREVELTGEGPWSLSGLHGEIFVTSNGDGTFSYTYTLTGNVDHENPELNGGDDGRFDDDTVNDPFVIEVRSPEGVVLASSDIIIVITDDGPEILPGEQSLPQLVTQDSALASGNNADSGEDTDSAGVIGTVFQVVFGADGPQLVQGNDDAPLLEGESGMTFAFGVLNGVDSGLLDTLTGRPIFLFTSEDGTTVYATVGHADGGSNVEGEPVFSLSVDGFGKLTLNQFRSIQHDAPEEGVDGSDQIKVLNLGEVPFVLNITATDGDGDSATSSLDLNGKLAFGDDTPELIRGEDGKPKGLNSLDLEEESVLRDGQYIGNNEEDDGLSTQGGSTIREGVINWGADTFGGVVKATVGGVDHTPVEGLITVRFGADGLVLPAESEAPASAILTIHAQGENAGKYTLEVVGPLTHGTQTHTDLFGLDQDARNAAMQAAEDRLDLQIITIVGQDKDGDRIAVDLQARVQDDVPEVLVNPPAQELTPGFTVAYKGGEAGHNNSFGWFIKGENGEPVSGTIIWGNVKTGTTASVDLPAGVSPDQVGFFIIPNGASPLNQGLTDNTPVTFVQNTNGAWVAMLGDKALNGTGAPAFFSNQSLNPDDQSHVQNAPSGTQAGQSGSGNFNWEDLVIGPRSSDKDYDDINIKFEWTGVPLLVRDQLDDTVSRDTDQEAPLSSRFQFNFGADGEAAADARTFGLRLEEGAQTALRDSATQQGVQLKTDANGNVVGFVMVDGAEKAVFQLSVSESGVLEVELFRAVMHPTNNPHEITNIGSGVVFLTATAKDGDGDTASNRFDIGRAINFQDTGPVAADDAQTVMANQSDGKLTFNVLDNDQFEGELDGAPAEVVWNRAGGDRSNNVTDFFDEPGESTLDAQGRIGSLAIQRDGTATFTLDQFKAMALGESHSVVENFNYQMRDVDGDTDVANVKITVTGVNDRPEFVTGDDEVRTIGVDLNGDGRIVANEEGRFSEANEDRLTLRVQEDALANGNRETDAQTTTDSANFGVADPDIGDVPVVFFDTSVLPEVKSGGQSVTWTPNANNTQMVGKVGDTTILTVTINGTYATGYTADVKITGPVDHAPPVEGSTDDDVLNLQFKVVANDRPDDLANGATDTMKLIVTIEDDAPTAEFSSVNGTVVVNTISVGGFSAGFTNVVGQGTVSPFNRDVDPLIDELRWGSPTTTNGGQSGYIFVDNESIRTDTTPVLNSTFNLGTFTHNNFPIFSNTGVLQTANLVVNLNVVVNGVSQTIQHVLQLEHDETPNNTGTALGDRDIVTIKNTVADFNLGGEAFKLVISAQPSSTTGPDDAVTIGDGQIVLRTFEGQANSFTLNATVQSTDPLPKVEGAAEFSTGADGGVLTWTAQEGQEAETVKDADGNVLYVKITTAEGVFKGFADGTYTFEMSRQAKDAFDIENGKKLEFSFKVVDGDGDTVTEKVQINFEGRLAPQNDAPEVVAPAQTTVLANEAGVTSAGFEASLGVDVGRDTAGATIAFHDTSTARNSLNGTPVTAMVKVGGVDTQVALTSNGSALTYHDAGQGILEARNASGEVVFRVSGSAEQGTYKVEMVGTVDTVQHVSKTETVNMVTTETRTATANLTVPNQGTGNATASVSANLPDANADGQTNDGQLTLTFSAFLDQGGQANVRDGSDPAANVFVSSANNRGIGVDTPGWSGDNGSVSGNEERTISNNTRTSSETGFDGQYGEKLVMAVSSTNPTVKVTNITVTLNQFGDSVTSGSGHQGTGNEVATIAVTNGTTQGGQYTETATTGASTSTGTKQINITGTDITQVVFGAGNDVGTSTPSQYSVDQRIAVTYQYEQTVITPTEVTTLIPVDAGSEITLVFGATITDGWGSDQASTTFKVLIDNGDKVLTGTDGDDVIIAGDTGYTLVGGDGDDVLVGGKGNDVLIGGEGNDTLIGGEGDDVFKFELSNTDDVADTDRIVDFALGDNEIQIVAADLLNEDDVEITALLPGSDSAKIEVEGGGATQTIKIDGVDHASLTLDLNGPNPTIKLDDSSNP